MKHSVLVLALLMMAAGPVWARQDGGTSQHKEQIQQRLDDIKERLALTPEQIEQIRPVLEDELRKAQAVRQKYSGSTQSRRARMKMARELKDIRASADERLRTILTKQQMDELKKIGAERRTQLRQKGSWTREW